MSETDQQEGLEAASAVMVCWTPRWVAGAEVIGSARCVDTGDRVARWRVERVAEMLRVAKILKSPVAH